MKAVFDTKPTSIYDDDIERHYHFPSQYLPVIARSVGDWIVLRRPKRDGGDMTYFGIAHVAAIEPDAARPGMYFAILTDQWQFPRPVPLRVSNRYWEEELRSRPPNRVGVYLQGKSARSISDSDFAAIFAFGLADTLTAETDTAPIVVRNLAVAEEDVHSALEGAEPRRIERLMTNRVIRDIAFRKLICDAYGGRCAVTRLRIFDGQNNPEVQAAHIWSVATGGPDVLQNGLALSGTVHWLFDRHLITIGDDYRLIVAEGKIPEGLRGLAVANGTQLHLPEKTSERPHPDYLARHRAKFDEKNRR